MSNQFAIAAVTNTLFNLVFLGTRDELGSGNITALPSDKARSSRDGNQVNLFLYHTMPNPAFHNDYCRSRNKHSHAIKPPLALDLFYLITVYGQGDSEIKSHRLLGQIVNVLHDHPILHSKEIEFATAIDLADSDLHRQVEQINITPESLTFEEMSQIWRGFQAQYCHLLRAKSFYRYLPVEN